MLPIKDGGRDRRIALTGKAVAHRANVMIDAEYLLNDDDPALGRSARLSPIGAEFEIVRCGE
jgi:hypothetical protein